MEILRSYKYSAFLISMILACIMSMAQSPGKFSYQAVIRNSANNLVANQLISMRISIIQGSTTGSAVFAETHAVTTTTFGLANLEIGGGTPITGSIIGINWASGPYFIKTEIDLAGGTNYSLTGTTQLRSVPFALHASTAGNGLSNGTAVGQMFYWNGTEWVKLNQGNAGQILTLCNGVPTWTTGGQCGATVFSCPPLNDFNPSVTYGSMTDQEGNVYKTVAIGSQVWMAENLRTAKYRNGETILNVTNNTTWVESTTGASCWYNNDSVTNHCRYGKLYNWLAVKDSRNLCPSGWHVPSNNEWNTLFSFLGGENVAGSKMKTTSGWKANIDASNSSGFTGRPSGTRFNDGMFTNLTMDIFLWSSNVSNSGNTNLRYYTLHSDDGLIRTYNDGTTVSGFSVRCIKD